MLRQWVRANNGSLENGTAFHRYTEMQDSTKHRLQYYMIKEIDNIQYAAVRKITSA